MFLEDACFKIGNPLHRVGKFFCFTILQHHSAIFIVGIGECKGVGREIVEKRFLHIPVFQHILVIIEMILGEVGKDATRKTKTMNPLLMDGV